MLAVVRSRALGAGAGTTSGLAAPPVAVEVHLANGLPSLTIVGLPEAEVRESRERVRAALQTSGYSFPSRRITVNLAPADLPKASGRYDLPIAIGILAASGQIPGRALAAYEFAGELSLGGALRPVRGALAMALAAAAETPRPDLILPMASATEAALAPGMRVLAAATLAEVCAHLSETAADAGLPLAQPPAAPSGVGTAGGPSTADMADVRGQAAARRALEIAAAGGHGLLLVGPPGTGKTMLASRLPGLLPPLDPADALESAALASLTGAGLRLDAWRQRPFRAPHHGATMAALIGGGNPPRPGEASLAHHGVLFLDELPEFPRPALEALREPLESRRITVSRAASRAEFPAAFQLVAAMNPCPCGYHGHPQRACSCTPERVTRYQARISGPLLDRIDLQVVVPAIEADRLLDAPPGESTAIVAARVLAARRRQTEIRGAVNSDLTGRALDAACVLDADGRALLGRAMTAIAGSARAVHRALRVARTIADLAGSDAVGVTHLAEALQYQRALGS